MNVVWIDVRESDVKGLVPHGKGQDYKPKPISAIFTFSTLGLVIPVSIILHHGIMKQ